MKVDCKLYNYPESGHHIIKSPEHYHDAYLNINLWLDKYAMEPYRPQGTVTSKSSALEE